MSRGGWKSKLRQGIARVRALARRTRRTALPATTETAIGVALSGGFARAVAHIGVLKVLEENRIPIGFLAGTSAGSIIASAYAGGASLDQIADVARRLRWKDFGRWTLSRLGLASNHRLEAFLRRNFQARRFEDLKIPLAVVATDLNTGKPVVFTSGSLATAIRASCAYPGLFLPVQHNGTWLVDGALVAPVPTQAVRKLGAKFVLAISIDNIEWDVEPKNMVEVLGRSLSIAQATADPVWRKEANLVIEPQVSRYCWDDFQYTDELIAAGEAAMRKALPRLEKLLAKLETAPRTLPATA